MPRESEPKDISRRSFVKRTAMGGAGLLLATEILASDLSAEAHQKCELDDDGRSV